MAVTMDARWDNNGTVIPGGDAEYVVAEQPIAEYDNWFNYNVVSDIQAVIDDVINKFNPNTILKADTDNTPAALVVAEQTMVGRKTGNSIAALTDTEVRTILNVEDGSTADQTDNEIRDAVEAAADSNTFTDADHAKLNGIDAGATVPAGAILMWHGLLSAIPSGWTLCDGTSSTPDLRDKFVRGAAAAANPGTTGGSDTHTLTIAEMPAHTHTVASDTADGTASSAEEGAGTPYTFPTGSTGSGDAHNNMPAYYAIAYIMKT